jgi:uncharacterized protein YbjQ (UPF0145 family)
VLIVTTNDIPGWEIQRVCGAAGHAVPVTDAAKYTAQQLGHAAGGLDQMLRMLM